MKFTFATIASIAWFVGAVTSTSPPGDECITSIVVPSLPYNRVINTTIYSNNLRDPNATCNYGNEGKTVYFKFTPIIEGLLIVDTRGSVAVGGYKLDSVVSVFKGSCRSLTQVYCADQDFEETVYYAVSPGVTYTIKAGEGGNGSGGGLLNFTMSLQRNYFNLNNDVNGKTIGAFNDLYSGVYPDGGVSRSTINYANALFQTSDLSIEAIFSEPNSVQSVRLQLDNQQSVCENDFEKYKIYGELNNNNIPFAVGNRVITATAYSRWFCKGNVVDQISQAFEVKGCDFVHYGLYDASRDRYLSNLYNASSVPSPPCQVNIGVTFTCGFTPTTVRLELRKASDNSLVVRRDEFFSPYLLFSDNGFGDILPGSIQPGEYKLTAIIDNIVHPSVTFTLGACRATPAVDNTFDIDLRFAYDELSTYNTAKLFPPIVKRISSLVIGDKPDFTNVTALASDYFCGDYPPRIDDLFVCTGIFDYQDEAGGILGFLLNTYTRQSDRLPITGTILFDTTLFQNQLLSGKAESYILQQFIRTLGLGEYWKKFNLVTNSTPPCSYTGTKAKAEFAALTGCSANIPLEQNSVPEFPGYGDFTFDCRFWDPTCLLNEVLTFTLGPKKISRVTLASLEDLGYVVNYTAADPYGPSDIGTCAGCNGNRNLKGNGSNEMKKSSSCHSGIVHERAVRHGRKMLRDVHDHHIEQTKTKPTPKGLIFTGNQRVTVMYQHEDGTLCSVLVPADFLD